MMTEAKRAQVLVVDDEAASRRLLDVRLRGLACEALMASDGEEALALIQKEVPSLILLDLEMPRMKGMELLRKLRQDQLDIPVIVITAYGSIERAVEAMKEGAYDFIPKPFDPKHLEIVVLKALERQGLKRGIEVLAEETGKRYRLVIGQNANMNEAIETARKAAASKSTVLLLGESGTGKEIFARAIHAWSDRKDEPFVAINCVGLSKELLESELFGHAKGAFTGAHELKRGKIEVAQGGTLFLDEIGDVSPEVQTKLLRFLQEREFERVGGLKPISVDVRIIAATNRDLQEAINEGRFREDLYYRINVVPIFLPPLKERKEDIPTLALHFMERFSTETKKNFAAITPEAMEKIIAYDWPGNVRELANVIERAVVLGQEPMIQLADLAPGIVAVEAKTPSESVSYHEAVDGYRREVILRALAQTQGNRAAAARLLGLERSYFLRLMKSFRID
jgi:DNA-binding NtrC family response regulator